LTTLEKDLDHPSPLKNPQRTYSADAPISHSLKPDAPQPKESLA